MLCKLCEEFEYVAGITSASQNFWSQETPINLFFSGKWDHSSDIQGVVVEYENEEKNTKNI